MKQSMNRLIGRVDLRATLWNYFLLTVGSLLLITSVNVFLAPANISPGGVTGTAIIITHFTGWPIGLIMLTLNVPSLILGFRYLGRFRFLMRTLYVVLLYNLGVDFLGPWMPAGITDDLLLNALYSAVVGGIGGGLVFQGRGTTAGTSVLSRIIQMKTGVPISQLYLAVDGSVVFVAGLVFGWERALYALITLFVWGLVTDYVLEGPSVVRTAFIITDSPETVTQAVFERLHIGVTGWAARGMFTDAEHTILFCTVNRPDVNSLKVVVMEADPRAFIVIGQGHQARGGVLRAMIGGSDKATRQALREDKSLQAGQPAGR